MLKMTKLLVLPMFMALLMFGCSQDQNTAPTGPAGDLSLVTALNAADLQSATLYVYVNQSSNHEVSVHRITADWDEMAVTYNSFGGAFDAATVGTFVADGLGWRSSDVTALVAAWLDGTYDNFGVLLEHADGAFPRTVLNSREAADFFPTLEICYSTSTGVECVQLIATADAYIYQLYPDANTGAAETLGIGWYNETDQEKQALVRFEIPVQPEPAALGDFVWYDTDEDGIQDVGEQGIEGVVVHLYDCQDVLLATMMTDANGFYLFDDLMPGDYYVRFELPLAFVFTYQDQGADDAMDSDADRTTGRTICTTLDAGETDLTWDAGMFMPPPPEGCTLTIGYWKNHAGFGPQPDYLSQFLPIWLGEPGGTKSLFVDNVQMAYDILTQKVYGDPSNGITKLYAQLLAAKLNMANGSSDTDIEDELDWADDFLADYDWTDWGSLSKKDQKDVNKLKSTFDDYNNGYIGPGHCGH